MAMDQMCDHDSLQSLVLDEQLGVDAAFLHGSLVGLLCAGMRTDATHWLDHALPASDATKHLTESAGAYVRRLYQETVADLDDPDLGFDLYLPVNGSINEHAQGLVDWCGGFLGGLGLGGWKGERQLAGDVREAIADLRQIANSQLSFDHDPEVDENALMELVEFVRVSVVLLYDEISQPQTAMNRPKLH
jgi:uncharacterized protein